MASGSKISSGSRIAGSTAASRRTVLPFAPSGGGAAPF